MIPGEPCVQQRHRTSRQRNYDPSFDDKKDFRWKLIAACPNIKKQEPVGDVRLGILINVWSGKKQAKDRKTKKLHYQTDWDNYGKFYSDALNDFLWQDDSQIDNGQVIVHRAAEVPRVEILVYEIQPDNV